jgi:copper chaperone NosL
MIISDPRFAAATLTTDGVMSLFDDTGDMLIFHAKHPELEVRAWFVHDYDTEEWIRGESAFFVKSPGVHSPMGHGIAAFEDRGAAEALAQPMTASILTFDELRAAVLAQSLR